MNLSRSSGRLARPKSWSTPLPVMTSPQRNSVTGRGPRPSAVISGPIADTDSRVQLSHRALTSRRRLSLSAAVPGVAPRGGIEGHVQERRRPTVEDRPYATNRAPRPKLSPDHPELGYDLSRPYESAHFSPTS